MSVGGGSEWQTDSAYCWRRIRRSHDNGGGVGYSDGSVTGWLPAHKSDFVSERDAQPAALWHGTEAADQTALPARCTVRPAAAAADHVDAGRVDRKREGRKAGRRSRVPLKEDGRGRGAFLSFPPLPARDQTGPCFLLLRRSSPLRPPGSH